MEHLLDQLRNQNTIELLIQSIYTTRTKELEKEIHVQASALKSKGISKKSAKKLALKFIRENKKTLLDEMSMMISSIKPLILGSLSKSIKGAHIKSLRELPRGTERIVRFKSLNYRVENYKQDSIILSDSIVMAVSSTERKFCGFWDDLDGAIAIILPLSSSQLLIGSIELFEISAAEYNLAAAKLSSEFFVSKSYSGVERELSYLIGSESFMLSDSQLLDIIKSRDIQSAFSMRS